MSGILLVELQVPVQLMNAIASGLTAEHVQCNLQQGHQ